MSGASDRLRVVHVIDSLAGSGGAENRLVDEVIALDDRFDQAVVRLYERDFLQARLADADIEVVPLGFQASRAARSWPLAARKLRRLLRERRADVVHTSLFNGNLVGQLAGTAAGLPVVSTFNHTGERHLQQALRTGASSRRAQAMQRIGRWAERRGDVHYRAVGAHCRDTNLEWRGLSRDKATVIHRGVVVSPAEVSDAGRAGFGLPEGVPLFVNVARLVPEKAQHLLVQAFAQVRAELPDAQLAIVGAMGSAEATVRAALADSRLDDAVHLLDFRGDARSLVAASDVFAFSSRSEGSPGVVVEALALGTAVAAFAIPPVAELTDDGRHAWLAPDGSVDDLAQAMLAAYRAPDRSSREVAAQHWAERFQLAAIADEQLGDLLEARVRPGAPALAAAAL